MSTPVVPRPLCPDRREGGDEQWCGHDPARHLSPKRGSLVLVDHHAAHAIAGRNRERPKGCPRTLPGRWQAQNNARPDEGDERRVGDLVRTPSCLICIRTGRGRSVFGGMFCFSRPAAVAASFEQAERFATRTRPWVYPAAVWGILARSSASLIVSLPPASVACATSRAESAARA